MTAVISALFRHPIKGFTPEKVKLAELSVGKAFPGDRLFALEDGPSGFDPANPGFIPKQRFAVLAKIAAVARARTRLDDRTGLFHAEAEGHQPYVGDLAEPAGRAAFAEWATGVLGPAAAGPLRLIDGAGHRFLDHPLGHVSIVNLASVRELERTLGRTVDPLRFRANLYLDGLAPWAESQWLNQDIEIGPVRLSVFASTGRCEATNVDPATGARDLAIPAHLQRTWGHLQFGVYARVVEGNRSRIQIFQGVVIRRQGGGLRETFTVRKVSFGVGVERTYPLNSPALDKIEIVTRGDVRRAKLYYLRELRGKKAKIKELREKVAAS